MYLSPWKFFRNQILLDYLGRWRDQSCQIFFHSVHSGVSGTGSNFAIFSANRRWPLQLLYYRTTVIIMECWKLRRIPNCWKIGGTISIYKKGDPDDPAYFRPITLQPVLYKIFLSIIKKRLFEYVSKNNYIDRKMQKGFWPCIDRVCEHTECLNHLITDANRHQRSLTIKIL